MRHDTQLKALKKHYWEPRIMCMSGIPALSKLRQEDEEFKFKASLGYTGKPCFINKN
jgi:hypothetical protein